MAVAQLSPGVVINEVDLSQYVAKISTATFGIVGAAEWGPVEEPTLVTTEADFVSKFGKPMDLSDGTLTAKQLAARYAGHAATHFLKQGNRLYFIRLTTSGDAAANAKYTDVNSVPIFDVDAIYSGELGNRIRLVIDVAASESTIADPAHISIRVEVDFLGTGVYKTVESYPRVSINAVEVSAYTGSEDYIILYNATNDLNSEPHPKSVAALTSWMKFNAVGTAGSSNLRSLPEIINFTGGLNGDDLPDNIITGSSDIFTGLSGLQRLRDTSLDVNIIAAPGLQGQEASIQHELISIAESRKDCIALLDPPQGLSPTAVVDWANGAANSGNNSAFNSSYAAVYYPWIQYFDPYNGVSVFTPPSGWVAGVMAKNDRRAGPQFAPMGLNRGTISEATGIENPEVADLGVREFLYGNNNVVNPIVAFPEFGIVVWGQRTTQRVDSALDRVDIRRMMIVLEKSIASSVLFLVGEKNNSKTRRRFVQLVKPVLDGMVANEGILEYSIKVDESINTPDVVANNQLVGQIFIKPTLTAEVIAVDFVLTDQSTTFTESTI